MTKDEMKRAFDELLAQADSPEYNLPNSRALVEYIVYGKSVGGFLSGVIANNLTGAACRADSANLKALGAYGRFMMHHAPASCYGSERELESWGGAGSRPSLYCFG
jgi:hypothetical protein